MLNKIFYKLLFSVSVILLAACGGGGNADPEVIEPTVVVAAPVNNSFTYDAVISISGTANNASGIDVNGVSANSTDDFATWSVNVDLQLGVNNLTLNVINSAGETIEVASLTITRIEYPSVNILSPINNSLSSEESIIVNGTSSGATAVSIANVAAISSDNFATWTAQINLTLGLNTLEVKAVDSNNNEVSLENYLITRVEKATAAIDFPPLMSLTNADNITVRGSATNATAISVNGINATSTDNFATWSVNVDLDIGSNDLMLSATDASATTEQVLTHNIIREVILRRPEKMTTDIANKKAYVVDTVLDAVVAIDLLTGARSILSGHGVGTGDNFSSPRGISLDTTVSPNRLLVIDFGLRALVAVDLINGDRTILSSSSVGTGSGFSLPTILTVDAVSSSAIVRDAGNNKFISVDLTSGNRSDFSVDAAAGKSFEDIIITDETTPRALTIDIINDELLAIDLSDGARTVISDNSASYSASEIDFNNSYSLIQQGNFAYIADLSEDAIIKVDITNGVNSGIRTILSNHNNGTGLNFEKPTSVRFLDASTLVVADEDLDALLSVDIITGDRQIISNSTIGSGVTLSGPDHVAFYSSENKLFYSEDDTDAIISLSLETLERQTISDSVSVGSGAVINNIRGVQFDNVNQRLFYLGISPSLLAEVDLANGNRSVISGRDGVNEIGIGESLSFPNSITLDDTFTKAYVMGVNLSDDALFEVSLANGDRSIVSSNAAIGTGQDFVWPTGLAFDPDFQRVLISEYSSCPAGVLEVPLTTQNRSLFSGSFTSGGCGSTPVQGAGDEFSGSSDIVYDNTNQRIIVLDEGRDDDAVIEVDATNGDRTRLSSRTVGSGPMFDGPSSLVLDENRNIAYVSDSSTKEIYAVDLQYGNRVLIAK